MKLALKGNNQIRLFRRAAERLVSKITASKNVAGVILLGSPARGFAEKYPDIDSARWAQLRSDNQVLR